MSEATAPSKVLVHEAILQGPGLAAGGLDPEGRIPAVGAELGRLGDSCSWSTPRGLSIERGSTVTTSTLPPPLFPGPPKQMFLIETVHFRTVPLQELAA